jgi:HK97 family phage portal protein
LLKGNGYIYIHRSESGLITSLEWIPAQDVTIELNEQTRTVKYRVNRFNKLVKPEDIIHFIKNTNDGFRGRSVLSFGNEVVQLSLKTENSAMKFFNSGCAVSGILTPNQGVRLNDRQRSEIKQSWQNEVQNNNLQVLPYDVSYQPISTNNVDSQLLQSREYNTKEICRFFGVNPLLIQDNTATTYNTLEQVNLHFLQYTLQPYVKMIEVEMTRKLFANQDDMYVEMDEEQYLLKADKLTTARYYGEFIKTGVMSINEVRKYLGLDSIESGDDHHVLYSDTSKTKI